MSKHLVAVTIGIGEEHQRLAFLAADRMRRGTGLNVKIFGAEDLATVGAAHPCHLKFHLFDLVDAENILYFDSDVFCLRPWDPKPLSDRREWTAVRGWWHDPWIERCGAGYGVDEEIFNAGLFVCNRTHHARMLQCAAALQPPDNRLQGLSDPDEIALNAARSILNVPLQLLDRRHNWIQFGRGNLSQHAQVVMAHACDRELRTWYAQDPPELAYVPRGSEVEAMPSAVAGKTFIYDRIGYDLRPMTFRDDGTIGAGSGGAERYCLMEGERGQERLVIGGEHDATCVFREDLDGVWRGRWLEHERMPVSLTKHRAQNILDLLSSRPGPAGNLTGVEVGVYQGETSEILLRGSPRLHLYMVDPWRVAMAESDYWLTNAGDATMTQPMFDAAMLRAAQRTAFAGNRRTMVPSPSCRAAGFLPDNFDFVFIDGDHSYSGVLADLEAWFPKVAPHGLLCGHDYANSNFPGVKKGVDEFAARHGLNVQTASDLIWYFA